MNERTEMGLGILEAALLLAILGDALLRATPWGLNLLLWIIGLVAAMTALNLQRRRDLWTRETVWLHGALIGFGALFVWRDSSVLQVLDVLIVLAILSILTLPALKIQTKAAGFLHYVLGAMNAGANAAFAPLFLVFGDIEWKAIPRTGWMKHLISVLRGLAIAAPILVVFGILFMMADAVFENIVRNTLNINPQVLCNHFLLFGFLAWITGGYLRAVLLENPFATLANAATNVPQNLSIARQESIVDENSESPDLPTTETKQTNVSMPENHFFSLGAIEIGVVLGLINLLFLGFVIVQIRYFFGGMDFVQATDNFKLADYARRGFFELCWVAALTLPILLTSHWLLRKDNPQNERIFRVFAGINIALLFVIMFSAVQRMLLYTGNLGYGLTEMRLYPTAFMLWLALVFVWFGLTVLRGQTKLFAWGALWTALLVIAGLHVLNPDDLIVRQNVRLMQQGRIFDARYLSHLSEDATPALIEALPYLSYEDACIVFGHLEHRLKNRNDDFRTWNLSRQTALKKFAQQSDNLQLNSCNYLFGSHGEDNCYRGSINK